MKKVDVYIEQVDAAHLPQSGRARVSGKAGGIPQGWKTLQMTETEFAGFLREVPKYRDFPFCEDKVNQILAAVASPAFNDWIYW